MPQVDPVRLRRARIMLWIGAGLCLASAIFTVASGQLRWWNGLQMVGMAFFFAGTFAIIKRRRLGVYVMLAGALCSASSVVVFMMLRR